MQDTENILTLMKCVLLEKQVRLNCESAFSHVLIQKYHAGITDFVAAEPAHSDDGSYCVSSAAACTLLLSLHNSSLNCRWPSFIRLSGVTQ